jgi:hypothetical protein
MYGMYIHVYNLKIYLFGKVLVYYCVCVQFSFQFFVNILNQDEDINLLRYLCVYILLIHTCTCTAGFRTRIVQNDCNLPQKVK